jgi:hypothetical protein
MFLLGATATRLLAATVAAEKSPPPGYQYLL